MDHSISSIHVATSDFAITRCHSRVYAASISARVPPRLLHHRAAPRPRQAVAVRRPRPGGPRPPHPGGRRRPAHPPPGDHRRPARRHPRAGGEPLRQTTPHALRLPPRHGPPRPQGPRRGPGAHVRRQRQPRVRGPRRHLRTAAQRVRPPFDRRQRTAADRFRALRREVQQRLLRRRADGLRRRGRGDLPGLHRRHRRDRPRAGARPDPVHGQSELLRPVRRAQRVGVGRVRLPGQAVLPGPDRRAGRLADRRGAAGPAGPGCGAALDEGARYGVRRRRARQGPAARLHGRLHPHG